MTKDRQKDFETQAVRTQVPGTGQREHSVPLFMTSSYTFNNAEHARALFAHELEGNVYSRYSNPNVDEFVRKMCLLEQADAGVATSSGMSAVFSSLAALLNSGDHVLASRSLFGSSLQILNTILPRWNVSAGLADIYHPEEWEGLIQDNTRMLFIETPSNPGLDLIDLEWAGNLARRHGLVLVVDNCFATPYLQQPMNYGADLVVHSATKFIDGQGRAIGGVIVGRKKYIDEVKFFTRHSGPALSPFNAWLLSKSLETLPVRMEKHCENALALARFLEDHPGVETVRYPFLESHPQYELARRQMKLGGGIVVFTPKGGFDQAREFLDRLDMISLSANLGDTRTIATHPASTTHSRLTEEERQAVGITPGLIRLSVGLESLDDIIGDVKQALPSA